jgi:hypothetical protein
LESAVKAKVDSGLYDNASEVIREALPHSLLREREKVRFFRGTLLRHTDDLLYFMDFLSWDGRAHCFQVSLAHQTTSCLSVKNFSLFLWAMLVLGGIGFSGCSTAQMSLPKDLTQKTPVTYAVSGRQGVQFGPIRFGPYTMAHLNRGITTSERLGIFVFNASRARRPFRFELQRPESAPIAVSGNTQDKWMDLDFGDDRWNLQWGLRGETVTTASFSVSGQDWVLALSGDEEDDFWLRGVLTDGVRRVEILATRRLQGAAWDIEREVGYSFVEKGKTLGAVETINAGRVIFRPGLDAATRDVLAAASGVLLLDFTSVR